MPLQSMLVRDLRRVHGQASFRQILECAFPTRYQGLVTLMDDETPVPASTPTTQSTCGSHKKVTALPLEGDKLSFGKVLGGEREVNLRFPNDFKDTGNHHSRQPGNSDHSEACFEEFEAWVQKNATQLYWDDLAGLPKHVINKSYWKEPCTIGLTTEHT